MEFGSLSVLLTGPRSTLLPVPPKKEPLAVEIRVYRPVDEDTCLAIYNENEPGRFPEGAAGLFRQFLHDPGYLKLLALADGRPAAVGGIGLIPGLFADQACLVFGMVKPILHGQGIGTAMLLARLAALPRPVKPIRVLLSNVEASAGFFARFGFVRHGQVALPTSGEFLEVKSALLDGGGWDTCHALIRRMRIDVASFPPVPILDLWKASFKT